MYVNFWYPMAASEELTDQPRKVRCMGLDFDRLERDSRKVAYAIPGSGRRDSKGWVLDPVPLVDGEQAATKLKAAG